MWSFKCKKEVKRTAQQAAATLTYRQKCWCLPVSKERQGAQLAGCAARTRQGEVKRRYFWDSGSSCCVTTHEPSIPSARETRPRAGLELLPAKPSALRYLHTAKHMRERRERKGYSTDLLCNSGWPGSHMLFAA